MRHRDEEEQVQGEALQTEPAPESTGEGGGGDEEAPATPFNPFALLGGESSDWHHVDDGNSISRGRVN